MDVRPSERGDKEENAPLSNSLSFGNRLMGGVNALKVNVQSEITSKIEEVRSDVKSGLSALDDKVKSQLRTYKKELNIWVRQKVTDSIIKFANDMRPKAKESLKDPDMCNCVKNLVDDVVDDIWPDIIDEIEYNLMMSVSQPFIEIPQKQHLVCLYPLLKIKYWYLYSTQPYDKTIWKQMKSFSFWFWKAAAAFPFYGVSQFFFVWDFFMRDLEDEYQLVSYILNFKTFYFVTQGVMKSIIGYFMLYNCAIMIDRSSLTVNNYQDLTKCVRDSPGASMKVYAEVIGFLLQIFFVYFAFLLLPLSKQKGKPRFIYNDTKTETGCFIRGGRIKYFMAYDFFALIGSVGLFILVYLLQRQPSIDNSGDYIFFAQICYGLLSFPFLLFKIPILNGRLTKAKSTAYDKKGNCVPKAKGIRFDYEEKTQGIKRQTLLDSMQMDIGEVMDF